MKKIHKFTDRWKCACIMVPAISQFLIKHHQFQKALEIAALGMNFLSLVLSMISLQQKQQLQLFFPVYGHFLMNSYENMRPYEQLLQNCHYFQDLSSIEYIGFNLQITFKIRVFVMIVLFITDLLGTSFLILGSIFSYIHPSCGSKMYFMDLMATLVFFALFPTQFCISIDETCIGNSPILKLYRLEFMIQFNVGWLGIYSLVFILIIYPIIYLSQRKCNILRLNSLFFQIIYFLVSIPFLTLALTNFIMSLWTSSAFINILTLSSAFISYILYNAGFEYNQQKIQQKQDHFELENNSKRLIKSQKLMKFHKEDNKNKRKIKYKKFIREYLNQLYHAKSKDENSEDKQQKRNDANQDDKQQAGKDDILQQKAQINGKKRDHLIGLYRQWHDKIYNQFHS